MRDPDLWARLLTYDFDPAAPQGSFARRLARAEGWRQAKANAAIAEYRRFLYLTQVGRRPIVPAPVVERVWDFHRAEPADYRSRLCPEVLRAPAFRGDSPALLDPAARREGYRATRQLYRDEFGRAPPTHLWPDPDAWLKLRWRAFTHAARATAMLSVLVLLPIPGVWAEILPMAAFIGLIFCLLVAGGATGLHHRTRAVRTG